MRTTVAAAALAVLSASLIVSSSAAGADPTSAPAAAFSVGAQYDTSHVYVPPDQLDDFVTSFVATFGGTAGAKSAPTVVTPTPSTTRLRAVFTPSGTLSVFGFQGPVPYPFGSERTGYLVTDFDAALRAARAAGAAIVVAPFYDPIGRDVVVQWPGGVNMQFYWHPTPPHYAALAFIPENRVYLSPDDAGAFIAAFLKFSGGSVIADRTAAPGIEIGVAGGTYRCVRISSGFGDVTVLVTDGHLPYPYGRETTGYEVADLAPTLARATASGARVLVTPFVSDGRRAAMVQFPGGYIAEIHAEQK